VNAALTQNSTDRAAWEHAGNIPWRCAKRDRSSECIDARIWRSRPREDAPVKRRSHSAETEKFGHWTECWRHSCWGSGMCARWRRTRSGDERGPRRAR